MGRAGGGARRSTSRRSRGICPSTGKGRPDTAFLNAEPPAQNFWAGAGVVWVLEPGHQDNKLSVEPSAPLSREGKPKGLHLLEKQDLACHTPPHLWVLPSTPEIERQQGGCGATLGRGH